MTPIVYTVLTHFQFEVGSAIANSEKVQGAIDGISQSADNALGSINSLGLGFIANFGLGATGVLGVLTQAVKASDNFAKNQLAFSNIISSNMQSLTGDVGTFNDRMLTSGRILKDIAKDAQKFGLPEQDLASMTKMLAATLVPKGLAGTNFGEARNMGRNLLKSAPILGVEPGQVQGELMNLLGDKGAASQQNTLFRRLSTETKAFRDALGGAHGAAQKFNSLPLQKRFEIVRDGMGQFAKDMDVLAGNAQTVGAMMQRIRDLFVGFNGVLIPLGNALRGPLIGAFEELFKMINNEGRRVITEFSAVFKLFVKDVQQSAINLMQAKHFGKDFKGAGETLGAGVLIEWLHHLGLLGVIIRTLSFAFGGLFTVLGYFVPVLAPIGEALIWLGVAITEFMLALLPLLVVFQVISRAAAIGKINDLKKLPLVMAEFSELSRNFIELMMIVFGPFLALMDKIAASISWIFEWNFWLGMVVEGFKVFINVLVTMFGIIRGIVFWVGQVAQNLSQGNILGAFSGAGSAFGEGRDDFFNQYLAKTQKSDGSTNTTGNVTNIAKVEINNQFKEQMEPDRIAFSLKDQLLKAANNPLQASRNSLAARAAR